MTWRIITALFNPESFWREIIKYGMLYKRRFPQKWFLFRHEVTRECAMFREPREGVTKRSVEELYPKINSHPCQIYFSPRSPYNLSWEETIIISHLVKMMAPAKIFEFGTFNGRTTMHLAINSPETAIVYSIDIKTGIFDFNTDGVYLNETSIGEYILKSPVASKIRMLKGDSRSFDFSQYEKSIDFIFIDGDHSYDSVISDSMNSFKMVRPGGVVMWHDYLLIKDVTEALSNICKGKCLINLKGTSLVVWQCPA